MAVQYTAIHGQNQAARREAKMRLSTPAREALNFKKSWEKLMLILAANFRRQDLMVTLTYRDENLPPTRDEADKRLTAFIRALRKERQGRGQPLVYVRATEGYHSDGRLHHHLVINATGDDFETIRRLWQKNGDDMKFDLFGSDGPERWGQYLTKEPRIKGRKYVGDRTWRTSRNVKKPVSSCCFVPAQSGLAPPPGAAVIDRTENHNSFGSFYHVVARLPEK